MCIYIYMYIMITIPNLSNSPRFWPWHTHKCLTTHHQGYLGNFASTHCWVCWGYHGGKPNKQNSSEPHGHTDLFKCEHIVTLQNSGDKQERLTFHQLLLPLFLIYTTQKRDRTVGTTYSSVLPPVPSWSITTETGMFTRGKKLNLAAVELCWLTTDYFGGLYWLRFKHDPHYHM